MQRLTSALALAVCASGCLWSPASHSHKENTETIPMSGWALGPNKPITLRARNYETSAVDELVTVFSGATESPAGSGLYPWSYTSTALPRRYWAPTGLGVTNKSIGRAEISAMHEGVQLLTFTEAAQTCAAGKIYAGETLSNAGSQCSDGNEVILHDNSGVYTAPEPVSFTVVGTRNVGSPSVSVSVVQYNSDGNEVYGLLCKPSTGTNLKTSIYNHGGMGGISEADANSCVWWAQNGWVSTMSAYRGEPVVVPAGWGFGATSFLSTGVVETSLGEVKDVLRLLEITRAQPYVNTSRILLWGGSHGGAITLRALESGAQVAAAIALAPATDWAQTFSDCIGNPDPICAFIVNSANPPASWLASMLGGTPSSNPNSYSWRSPTFFPKDLAARKDVKIAIMHGIADATVNVSQACKLASAAWGGDFRAFHVPNVPSAGAATTAAVAACPGITFSAGTRPTTSWPDNRYLLVYDALTHGLGGNITTDFFNLIVSLGW